MPAIIRVKRRIDEEPLSAFILNGKKRRLNSEDAENISALSAAKDNGDNEISTILKFAGTLNEQDNNATKQYARLTKDAAKDLIQQKDRRPGTYMDRSRKDVRQASHDNRFRIVNCLRTKLDVAPDGDDSVGVDGKNTKDLTIFDIEKAQTTSTTKCEVPMPDDTPSTSTSSIVGTRINQQHEEQLQPTDSDSGYVYDLYLPENDQQAEYVDLIDDNYLSVRAIDNVFFEDCYDRDSDHDSEDSNEENYFTNDYPDEEDSNGNQSSDVGSDDDYDGTRDLCHGVQKFVFNDSDDDEAYEGAIGYGSDPSEDDEDDFIQCKSSFSHIVDTADANFIPDIDCTVANWESNRLKTENINDNISRTSKENHQNEDSIN